jgi:hypothetical protein
MTTGLQLEGFRHLPRQHRLSTSSSLSTSPMSTPASLYQHVLRCTQCTTSGPSSQSPGKRGYGGIEMSGVTPKHQVVPGDHDRRGRGGSSSSTTFWQKNKSEKRNVWRLQRKDRSKWRRIIEDKGHLSAKLTSSPKAPFTVEARPKTTISKVGVRVNPLGVRALFSTPVFPTGFFEMEF